MKKDGGKEKTGGQDRKERKNFLRVKLKKKKKKKKKKKSLPGKSLGTDGATNARLITALSLTWKVHIAINLKVFGTSDT